MCVCMYPLLYPSLYDVYGLMYIYIHLCIYIYIYTYTYAFSLLYMPNLFWICMRICVCIYIHMCCNIYI